MWFVVRSCDWQKPWLSNASFWVVRPQIWYTFPAHCIATSPPEVFRYTKKNYTIIVLKSSNSELGRQEHIRIVERGRVCICNLQLDSQLTTSTKYSNTCIHTVNMPPKLWVSVYKLDNKIVAVLIVDCRPILCIWNYSTWHIDQTGSQIQSNSASQKCSRDIYN